MISKKIKNLSLTTKFLLLGLIPSILITVVLGSLYISNLLSNMNHNFLALGKSLSEEISLILIDDNKNSKSKIEKLKENNSNIIKFIEIYDNDGNLINNFGGNNNFIVKNIVEKKEAMVLKNYNNDYFSFINPVVENNKIKFWVIVKLMYKDVESFDFKLVITYLITMFIVISISIFLSYKFNKEFSRPLREIIKIINGIQKGEYSEIKNIQKFPIYLKAISNGINLMVKNILSYQNEMQDNINKTTLNLKTTLKIIEKQNAELRKAKKKADNLSKTKSQFLANMSHEIRTPMNGILGFLELLKTTNLNDQQYEYLSNVSKSSLTLMQIINDILDFSKIESNNLEIEYKDFNLKNTIEDSVKLFVPVANEKGVYVDCFIDQNIPNICYGDSLRVQQIFNNLLSNAIKFTKKGSVKLLAKKINSNKKNKVSLEFKVIDTGIGISKENKDKIFNAFSQADNTITRQFGGTGLGLSIVKKLISLMKGTIKIESTIKEGTTFIINLDFNYIKSENSFLNLESYNIVIYNKYETNFLIKEQLENLNAKVNSFSNEESLIDYLVETDKVDFIILLFPNILSLEKDNKVISFKKDFLDEVRSFTDAKFILVSNEEKYKLKNFELFYNLNIQHCFGIPLLFSDILNSFYYVNKYKDNKSDTDKKYNFQGKSVLIVDDNEINIKLAKHICKNLKLDVDYCFNGKKAINYTQNKFYDYILLDIYMPEIDGLEVCRIIRTVQKNEKTIIIAVTADLQDELKRKINQGGFNGYIFKPININELISNLVKHSNFNIIEHKDKSEDLDKSIEIFSYKNGLAFLNNDKESYIEILNLFIVEIEKVFKVLESQKTNFELKKLIEVIHKINGSSSYTGTKLLKLKLSEFEEYLKSKNSKDLDKKIVLEKIINLEKVLIDSKNEIIKYLG